MKRCVVREGNREWRTVDDEPILGCTVFLELLIISHQKEAIIRGGDYFKYCSQEVVH